MPYRAMIDQLPIGVALTNIEGRILHVNAEFVELLGFESEEELLAANAKDLYAIPAQREARLKVIYQEGKLRESLALMVNGKSKVFQVCTVLFENHRTDLLLTAIWGKDA